MKRFDAFARIGYLVKDGSHDGFHRILREVERRVEVDEPGSKKAHDFLNGLMLLTESFAFEALKRRFPHGLTAQTGFYVHEDLSELVYNPVCRVTERKVPVMLLYAGDKNGRIKFQDVPLISVHV